MGDGSTDINRPLGPMFVRQEPRETLPASRWERYFLREALQAAEMSKDPRTRVGAVIVGADREIIATGFNGFPRGVADTTARLADRDTKNSLMVHAEMNAVLSAGRRGVTVKGCTLYLLAADDTGQVWGGPPCLPCSLGVIQAGIAEIVSVPFKDGPSNWRESIEKARTILHEAKIKYREVARP